MIEIASSVPVKISLSRLPATGSIILGRKEELKILDNAWMDDGIYVVTLVARAGVGKTALMKEWLKRMKRNNYRGAERVYGWSFYSQGTSEERQISSDEFIYDALRFFGSPVPPQGSPADKGRALARLVRQQKTLLILDGLEPLQYPPGKKHGFLKDQAIRALLEELALYQPGMCLLTTRLPIKDVDEFLDESVTRVWLGHLRPETGAKLLKRMGVKGTQEELEKTAVEFEGHALALNLLGRYLAVVHGGDLKKKDQVPPLTEEDKEGCHARRVLKCFEYFLSGKPELNILRMMGIFDRPADQGAIDALRTEVPINGVTSEVGNLSDKQWKYVLKRLRTLNLLADKSENPESGTLDCHPVVREYFGDRLKQDNPQAWREAHSCLFDYYRNLPGKKYPETLKDMEPLFFAITHGCNAGRHQEALDEVYWDRIRRGNTSYSVKKLGAVGADLAALSDFFDVAWKTPTGGLGDFRKALVLSWVGSRLRPLGRLREASQAVTASLDAFVKQENWKEAAVNAGNLSEIYLALGELKMAAEAARLGAEFSERSGDIFQQIVRNSDLANVLHQCGYIKEAEELFIDAEKMQKERQPDYPFLYSLQGFHYCDFLLTQGKYREVIDRAEQTLEWVAQAGWLLDISMDELSLGCAYLMQTQAEGGTDYSQASNYLDLATAGLQRAESQHHLPRGLLARAALFRMKKEFSNAWNDLKEVARIAQRGKMKLFMADYYLEAARLFLAEGNTAEAKEHLRIAKNMINRMGYHRRDKEVGELMGAMFTV